MSGRLDLTSHAWAGHQHLILFDGVCHWCMAWVDVAIAHDPRKRFIFAALQSDPARQILTALRLPTENFDTMLLLEGGRVFTKSTAALRIAKRLSGLFPILYLLILIPRPIRDALYDYVARRRYRWMGKAASCRIPTPAERERFV
jgi:predicted DCC family thiol-disulfide oxidoreductase YuxK